MQNKTTVKQGYPRKYIPAAGKDWRLPLYDPLCKLFGMDRAREQLISRAGLEATHRVLDIGCGTGTLILAIKHLYPAIEITGLDPDPKALNKAKRKTGRANYAARFDQGFSDALPYPPATFDRIFSSYMLHHMSDREKEATLFEVKRVLRPEGAFHMLDFEKREGEKKAVFADTARYFALMKEAGFADIRKLAGEDTLFGSIAYYKATIS